MQPARKAITPEKVPEEKAKKVLDFLNKAQTAEEIASAVEFPMERDVGLAVARNILAARAKLGRFSNLKQVAEIDQVGPERFSEIINALSEPKASVRVRITAKIEGAKDAEMPLKAVIYVEQKEEIKILAEKAIETEELELDLGVAEELPPTVKLAVVPQEVKPKSLIRRLAESGSAPSATITRELALAKKGKITAADLPLKPARDIFRIWPLKRRVCGRVIRRDPVTGDICYVPGATVRVLDVDFHLFWWYPYPSLPWCWLFPIWPRREEIATVKTDECGRFCVDIPYFDIDAILRWRLRYRCLWETLQPPRVIDAIDLGIKPDLRVYKELERLPELEPKPIPGPWPGPGPLESTLSITEKLIQETDPKIAKANPATCRGSTVAERVSDFHTKPIFEPVREAVFAKRAMFEPVDPAEVPMLERPAFPKSIVPPTLPEDETLLKILPSKEMLKEVRQARPIARLLRCWAELVPVWHIFFDVPDIVFKVEQDTDGDGTLETIYDQGIFDINWNLTEPTMNVVIEAWENAICVPCGPPYQPCTTTGIVGITEMPVDPAYLNNEGYAIRVNRPKPNGIRPAAKAPFCSTLRLVGCPNYGNAAYYKVFYKYENEPETFFKESWYVYHISASTPHHVVPDTNGFYPVLNPPSDYFPYHTLINWRSHNYPNGKYTIRLALYDAAHKPIGPALHSINVKIDNSYPSRLDFLSLKWRVGTGAWTSVPLGCPIIRRPAGSDIELKVEYNVAADHLRDYIIRFRGCGQTPLSTWNKDYWHHNTSDNNRVDTWTVPFSGTTTQGGYYFYLEGRSRAFRGYGGLAANWYIDPLHIYKGKHQTVVILDT